MDKNVIFIARTLALFLIVSASMQAYTQTTRKPKVAPKKKTPVSTQVKTETTEVVSTPTVLEKKNERPDRDLSTERANKRPENSNAASVNVASPVFYYEFTQPDFTISRILIEHDESGKGTVSFMKKGYGELVSDPIQLSLKTLDRINRALTSLDFLNSSENYQYEKNFSHLGTMTFRLTRNGKTRNATFNWTQNKETKLLMDEYRKIGNQYVWMFDISLARENQPLESPRLMDSLDSLIKRNEISDPIQMVPFLQGLANDERIPLIARNHATKISKQVEKVKK